MAEILSNGWQLQITIPSAGTGGVYNLGTDAAPTVSVAVTSKSWTSSGVETTLNRTVYGKAVLRKPYPDQASKDETVSGSDIIIKVVLNDFIYAGETVSNVAVSAGFRTDDGGGNSSTAINEDVINNSSVAYHLPVAMWINHDLDWVKASTYNVQMAVAHKDFRNSLPVRAVKFIATDAHSNTTSVTSSTMTKKDFLATGLSAPVFSCDLDFSGLTAGDMVTIDAIIYPWIGDAFQVSVSGDIYPSPNLTVLKVLNDRTGTYGTAYAYVNGVGGGTPTVSADAEIASANPYATIQAAAAAIQTYNNTTFTRNTASGGIIRLTPGVYTIASFSSVQVSDIPLLIESSDVANKSSTIFQDYGTAHATNCLPDRIKFRNITLRKNSSSYIFFDMAATKNGVHRLIVDSCIFDANGKAAYIGWFYGIGIGWIINCTGPELGQSLASGVITKQILAIGSTCGVGPATYSHIGCRATGLWRGGQDNAANVVPNGSFMGWGLLNASGATDIPVNVGREILPRGFAVVGSILESRLSGQKCMTLSADSATLPAQNVLDISNTGVGHRVNLGYQDIGTAYVYKDLISSLSVHWQINCKTDTYITASGARTGNWSVRYRVGSKNRVSLTGCNDLASNGPGLGTASVYAKGDAVGSIGAPINPHFIDDASFTGSGSGFGDYTPAETTELPRVPAEETAYPYDLLGRPVPTDGTALVGAVQRAAQSRNGWPLHYYKLLIR